MALIKVALVGQPNVGKSALINSVGNARLKVGNFSGVTVKKEVVRFSRDDYDFEITDLPGSYSLTDYTIEERVTKQYLNDSDYDLILNVVDSTNIERNLYLTTELLSLNKKVVVALNMDDEALKEGVHIEVRNDNGPQFSSKKTQAFFKENYLNQVLTHAYTPQENGHVESFHSILSTSIGNQQFWALSDLENRLKLFYQNYNNIRIHGSIAGLPPLIFWNLWEQGHIKRTIMKNKKVKFKLLIPAQLLSGIESLREVPCLENKTLEESCFLSKVEKMEAELPNLHIQPSVQRSPSVVPC
jgi:small GTP-binding protein